MGLVVRFLCCGSENEAICVHGHTHEFAVQNIECVNRLLVGGRGEEVVNKIASISREGRGARQDGLLLVLAMCARFGDDRTKRRAYDALNEVCRIPTNLFQFVELCKNLNMTAGAGSGWGRAHRRGIG